MRIGHKNNNILKIAIEYGCKTAKDLAKFLREYNPEVIIQNKSKDLAYVTIPRG
jgi:hypothetical protein